MRGMPPRLAPIALVVLAACEPGGDDASVPSAVTPQELLRSAMESPGDGSDILEAVGRFGATEAWRNAPAGLVVSPRSVEAILHADGGSDETASPAIGTTRTLPE
jgi:hypothetical protein